MRFPVTAISGAAVHESMHFGIKLFVFQVLKPKGVVGVLEVGALVAAVAVHSVWVDHKVEAFAVAVEGVQELEGVLVMDVVVAGAVG